MIDWIIKHLDVITDDIQRIQHSQTYEDLMYIKKVIQILLNKFMKAFGFVIVSFLSIISFGVATLLLWCLFRG